MKKPILFTFILVGMTAFGLSAQTIEPQNDLIINLDYSRFRYDDSSVYLEVYYGFHPRHLTFERSDKTYHGGVNLHTRLRNKASEDLLIDQKMSLALSEKDTSGVWYRFPFISQSGHVVGAGEYILHVIASDSLDPARADSMGLEVIIAPMGPEVVISDLELCKSVEASKNKKSLFYKNTLEVVPYPILIFGATTVPTITHYAEIYNLQPMSAYTVNTEILDADGNSLRKKTKQRKFRNTNSIEVGMTPVTAYRSGKYTFRLSLMDGSGGEVASTDKYFFVYNPHLQAMSEPVAVNQGSLDSLSTHQLDTEFEVARYVATELEMEMFSQLESAEAKSRFMYEFWNKVGQGRGDYPAIRRSEYLARKEVANTRYASMGKDGWQTDRGRVFLIYSQPDEIERVPSESGGRPYEIWRYFNIENGVEFFFVDRGYSGLELVHSTKRGEFRDDGWRRYLQ